MEAEKLREVCDLKSLPRGGLSGSAEAEHWPGSDQAGE